MSDARNASRFKVENRDATQVARRYHTDEDCQGVQNADPDDFVAVDDERIENENLELCQYCSGEREQSGKPCPQCGERVEQLPNHLRTDCPEQDNAMSPPRRSL